MNERKAERSTGQQFRNLCGNCFFANWRLSVTEIMANMGVPQQGKLHCTNPAVNDVAPLASEGSCAQRRVADTRLVV